jgi:hypothetical protein
VTVPDAIVQFAVNNVGAPVQTVLEPVIFITGAGLTVIAISAVVEGFVVIVQKPPSFT